MNLDEIRFSRKDSAFRIGTDGKRENNINGFFRIISKLKRELIIE